MTNVITLDDDVTTAIVKMAEGNPGAVQVLCEIVKRLGAEGFITLCHLDDMAIRGWKIWVGFKDYCKRDYDKFIELINQRDQVMQDFIHSHQG